MFDALQNLEVKPRGSATPLDAASIPGFLPKTKPEVSLEKFKIRYQKFDLDDIVDVTELEKIETKAIHNAGVFILSEKDFVFMDRMFILVKYMEEIK